MVWSTWLGACCLYLDGFPKCHSSYYFQVVIFRLLFTVQSAAEAFSEQITGMESVVTWHIIHEVSPSSTARCFNSDSSNFCRLWIPSRYKKVSAEFMRLPSYWTKAVRALPPTNSLKPELAESRESRSRTVRWGWLWLKFSRHHNEGTLGSRPQLVFRSRLHQNDGGVALRFPLCGLLAGQQLKRCRYQNVVRP